MAGTRRRKIQSYSLKDKSVSPVLILIYQNKPNTKFKIKIKRNERVRNALIPVPNRNPTNELNADLNAFFIFLELFISSPINAPIKEPKIKIKGLTKIIQDILPISAPRSLLFVPPLFLTIFAGMI